MRVLCPILFLILSVACSSPRVAADDRLPVPSAEAVKKADELIKSLFKDDYAKAKTKVALKQTLAAMLLKQAGEAKDDANSKYVLLTEARELAARAGDPDLAAKAASELATQFKLSPAEALIPVVDSITSGATTLVNAQAAAEVLMGGAEAAESADDWTSAAVLYKAAASAAFKGKMTALANEARDNAKNIDVTRAEADKLKTHLKTLKDKPEDPAANLAVGRFLCFFKGDWKTGLAHIAKGSDEKLAVAAKADEAASKGAETEQYAAAELWDGLAATAEAAIKSAIRGRAHYWYTTAAPALTGLTKVKATKRAEELKADADTRTMDWKFWAALRLATKEKQTKKWPLVGGAFSRMEFEDAPESGGILIGFRYSTTRGGEFPKAIQPIYLTAHGEVMGKGYGVHEKGAMIQTTKAKPGYAIGSLYTRGGGGLDALKPIYMRIDGMSLNTKDTYDGPYIGGKGGGEGTAGGTGDFIVGIHGKTSADFQIGTVSLVSLDGPVTTTPKK